MTSKADPAAAAMADNATLVETKAMCPADRLFGKPGKYHLSGAQAGQVGRLEATA